MSNNVAQSPLNLAREDKFIIAFQLPPALMNLERSFSRSQDTIVKNSVQFSIFGTVVPEVNVPAKQIRFAGNTLNVSSHSKESPPAIKVNFIVDNNYNNYFVLWKWLNLLHDQKEGTFDVDCITGATTDNNVYMTNMTVIGKDEYNENRIKFTYTRSFLTNLGDITYDYKDSKELLCNFTFAYSQIHTEIL